MKDDADTSGALHQAIGAIGRGEPVAASDRTAVLDALRSALTRELARKFAIGEDVNDPPRAAKRTGSPRP